MYSKHFSMNMRYERYVAICLIILALYICQMMLRRDGETSMVLFKTERVATVQNTSDKTLDFKQPDSFINLEDSNRIHIGGTKDISNKSAVAAKFRVQFSYRGRCVGISDDGALIVSFCDPTIKQAFVYLDGILKKEESSLCVGLQDSNTKELVLLKCTQAILLYLVDGKLVHDSQTGSQSCVSPMKITSKTRSLTSNPDLGAAVALTECDDPASHVTFLEETAFLQDRAALLMKSPQDDDCQFPARGANNRPPLPQLLPEIKVKRCRNLAECVTVVVKTARRPLLVIRLAESIRNVLNQDLPMIVIDDGPELHLPEVMDQVDKFPTIKYVVSEKEDLGISEGRMRGVNMVTTKYFVSMDDDNVVTESWDAAKMAELLDTTDVSLVGGRTDSLTWPGFLEFRCNEYGDPVLMQYMSSCIKANQTLPFYPDCMRCDLTSNSFMARTQDIIQVGGWSRELKIFEHHDIFLRLKAASKKVVWCPNFHVLNVHSGGAVRDEAYMKIRYKRLVQMMGLFLNHWNIKKFERHSQKENWSDTSLSWLNDL